MQPQQQDLSHCTVSLQQGKSWRFKSACLKLMMCYETVRVHFKPNPTCSAPSLLFARACATKPDVLKLCICAWHPTLWLQNKKLFIGRMVSPALYFVGSTAKEGGCAAGALRPSDTVAVPHRAEQSSGRSGGTAAAPSASSSQAAGSNA